MNEKDRPEERPFKDMPAATELPNNILSNGGTMAETARALLEAGYRLTPVRGKRPAQAGWTESDGIFMTDSAVWEGAGWIAGCGIGIQTGRRLRGLPDVFVIDIDGPVGQASWDAFCAERKISNRSPIEVQTGREGGRHLYFFGNPGKSAVALMPGVDLRASGAMVVAPPSLHPSSGRVYRWDIDIQRECDPSMAKRIRRIKRTGFGGAGSAGGYSCTDAEFVAATQLEAGLPGGCREHDFYFVVTAWLRIGLEPQRVWELSAQLHALSDTDPTNRFSAEDAARRTRQAIDVWNNDAWQRGALNTMLRGADR